MGQVSLVEPSAAAALIIARRTARAPQILLLKRSAAARFMPNAYVFPGGSVDEDDAGEQARQLCSGLDDAAASRQLSLPCNGLRFFVAAVREAFEEGGLLYAYQATDGLAAAGRTAKLVQADGAWLHRLRTDLQRERSGLAALCAAQGWRLAVDQLTYFAHWITPKGSPRRFDTRFFIARAPQEQIASLVGDEMAALTWASARDALAEHAAGRLELMLPTRTLLGEIAAFDDIEALFEFASRPREILPVTPPMPRK